MKNKYNIILTVIIAISTFSLCLIITHELNYISFPFNEVEVSLESTSASILKKEFGNEYETIMAAAARNGCEDENLLILFAIRKAENGPPGLEFGIMCQAGSGFDTQAGWAAATIMKNRKRWLTPPLTNENFITFLGNRYCPVSVDPQGNINWIRNVTYWYEKFKGKENEV